MIAQANSLHIPLPDKYVHAAITSPPYWPEVRDYGIPPIAWDGWVGCLGNEPEMKMYIEHLVIIFREVRRVLRDDGNFWLNISDTRSDDRQWHGVPHRLIHALKQDGWRWEDEIIWAKPNVLPSSSPNRCTRSHEYIFRLNKSSDAYFDVEAIKETATTKSWPGIGPKHGDVSKMGGDYKPMKVYPMRRKRTVWSVPTKSYRGLHFAAFPALLVSPMILASTSQKGCCPLCGAPWIRVVAHASALESGRKKMGLGPKTIQGGGPSSTLHHHIYTETLGWEAACGWEANEPIPCRVLDPFCGSGTVGEVCRKLNRQFIGLDLSFTYLQELALARAEGKTSAALMEKLPLFNRDMWEDKK